MTLAATCTSANAAEVRILAPAAGATLDATSTNTLVYEADPGASHSDHVHIYIDAREIAMLDGMKGDYALKGLSSGTREICVKLADKNHRPTNVGSCIQVQVK